MADHAILQKRAARSAPAVSIGPPGVGGKSMGSPPIPHLEQLVMESPEIFFDLQSHQQKEPTTNMAQFNLTKKHIAQWRQPGPPGFWAWVQDIEPRILTKAASMKSSSRLPNRHRLWTASWPNPRIYRSSAGPDGMESRHSFVFSFCGSCSQGPTGPPGSWAQSEQHSRRTQYCLDPQDHQKHPSSWPTRCRNPTA